MEFSIHLDTVPPLTSDQVEQLLTHLLRRSNLFALARTYLAPSQFDLAKEPGQQLLWTTAVKIASQCGSESLFGEPVTARALMEVEANALANPSKYVPEVLSEIFAPVQEWSNPPGLLYRIYAKPQAELNEAYGLDLLRRFLLERCVARPLSRRFKQAGDKLLADITGVLRQASEKEQIYGHLGDTAGGSVEDE
jgi:hypothetical protein